MSRVSGSTAGGATIWLGGIAHCTDIKSGLKVFAGHLAVDDGKIISIGFTRNIEEITQKLNLTKYIVSELTPTQFIMPGLVDCHLHAPQFPNLGLWLDKSFLEWLKCYTFPLEKLYDDITFATNIYDTVVNRTLKCGTTTACYFGSLHLESSVVLAAVAEDRGQRALVGKVSMNLPNDADYYNTTEKETEESEAFIKLVKDMGSDLVEPIITPRFALSCDSEMMKRLGKLAIKYDCKIQTHISENLGEMEAVKEMYPECETYSEVYDKVGLLSPKTILAHGVHLKDSELVLLKNREVSIAHCPSSNTRSSSGLCRVRKLIESGIIVGLGTDVSGGDSPSILDQMRRCMDVSIHLCSLDANYAKKYPAINWEEAFYLATLGGAKALRLDHKTGNFEVGKEFDALLIDVSFGSNIDQYDLPDEGSLSPSTDDEVVKYAVQRFFYLGDDRNIVKVFVKGREILYKSSF